MRSVVAVAALLPAWAVLAQFPQATFTLGWTEVLSGTNTPVASPNGMLEPGEGAQISMSVSFTPVGTPATYQYPLPGGVAPVAGFRSVGFSVVATTALGGEWSHSVFAAGFPGSIGLFQPDGSFHFGDLRQPDPPPGAYPIATNPLTNLWQAVWSPSTYAARQTGFQFVPSFDGGAPKLFVFRGLDPGGNPMFGYGEANRNSPTVQIPVAPAPDAGALVFCLGIAGARRRRRGSF